MQIALKKEILFIDNNLDDFYCIDCNLKKEECVILDFYDIY